MSDSFYPPLERARNAYLRMAADADHRPQYRGDGSSITAEADHYAAEVDESERSLDWFIGCTDAAAGEASLFAIQAAKMLNTGTTGRAVARQLLRMALADLEDVKG